MVKKQLPCGVCNRSAERMNGDRSECSHVDCPHRRTAWSEQTQAYQFFKGPWPKNIDADPEPIDFVIKD